MIATILTVFQYARVYFFKEDLQIRFWVEFVRIDELIKELGRLKGDAAWPRTSILSDHIKELERKRNELASKIEWWD